ncbi:MAG: hypothetical protein Q8R31_06855 [Candidatus Omnitrophota bacterium]|nr:hypothetical protein [Candidatus Omnitrophota bacterium]
MLRNKRQISLSRYPVIPLARSTGNRRTGNGLAILVLGFLTLSPLLFAQDEFKYDAKGKRNPFIPLVTPDGRLLRLEKEKTASGLLLEGIIYDGRGLSYAIVNGEVVKVSDKVGDYQVLKIEKNKIVFIKGGQNLEVELKEEEH